MLDQDDDKREAKRIRLTPVLEQMERQHLQSKSMQQDGNTATTASSLPPTRDHLRRSSLQLGPMMEWECESQEEEEEGAAGEGMDEDTGLMLEDAHINNNEEFIQCSRAVVEFQGLNDGFKDQFTLAIDLINGRDRLSWANYIYMHAPANGLEQG